MNLMDSLREELQGNKPCLYQYMHRYPMLFGEGEREGHGRMKKTVE
jgi:hypothetical protein